MKYFSVETFHNKRKQVSIENGKQYLWVKQVWIRNLSVPEFLVLRLNVEFYRPSHHIETSQFISNTNHGLDSMWGYCLGNKAKEKTNRKTVFKRKSMPSFPKNDYSLRPALHTHIFDSLLKNIKVFYLLLSYPTANFGQQTFTYSKSPIETLEKGVK